MIFIKIIILSVYVNLLYLNKAFSSQCLNFYENKNFLKQVHYILKREKEDVEKHLLSDKYTKTFFNPYPSLEVKKRFKLNMPISIKGAISNAFWISKVNLFLFELYLLFLDKYSCSGSTFLSFQKEKYLRKKFFKNKWLTWKYLNVKENKKILETIIDLYETAPENLVVKNTRYFKNFDIKHLPDLDTYLEYLIGTFWIENEYSTTFKYFSTVDAFKLIENLSILKDDSLASFLQKYLKEKRNFGSFTRLENHISLTDEIMIKYLINSSSFYSIIAYEENEKNGKKACNEKEKENFLEKIRSQIKMSKNFEKIISKFLKENLLSFKEFKEIKEKEEKSTYFSEKEKELISSYKMYKEKMILSLVDLNIPLFILKEILEKIDLKNVSLFSENIKEMIFDFRKFNKVDSWFSLSPHQLENIFSLQMLVMTAISLPSGCVLGGIFMNGVKVIGTKYFFSKLAQRFILKNQLKNLSTRGILKYRALQAGAIFAESLGFTIGFDIPENLILKRKYGVKQFRESLLYSFLVLRGLAGLKRISKISLSKAGISVSENTFHFLLLPLEMMYFSLFKFFWYAYKKQELTWKDFKGALYTSSFRVFVRGIVFDPFFRKKLGKWYD